MGELSTLDPAGPRAANLATLWWVMLWGALILFAIVIGLLGIIYLRPTLLARLTPSQWIVGGGLILPLPILIVLTSTALVLGEQLLPRGSDVRQFDAVAERWVWRFSYRDGRVPTSDTLHIPVGEPVDIHVSSQDVIHSFWVPRLGGKIDAIPGRTNVIRLEADKPGIYWGLCAEYCGTGHDTMLIRVEAHTLEEFTAIMSGSAQ
ncbi:cytochrome c oxidase subunit II [Ahrensia sp. 13_GOM-1096m]|uniref:cytochrome c oxidase subunit II n=1 Tax=Ahrensia sp. 13_GOM-1096m TaxID=1380380 RepID=UPI000685EFDB|nr:cytochrome c oxidase subunit II [Ahrensia sp. 13_GOM-1096m]